MAVANTDRRRYLRACGIGGAAGVAVFVRMLWVNGGIAAGSLFGGFYETQARAFHRFQWNVPLGSLGIEAFQIGLKQYEYYGPWPAIMRLPFMFLFPSMDGRWTQPSMLLALVVALVAASRLSWRIRGLVRADAPVTRVECFLVGLFTFVLAAGSVLLFLASQAWVYHEAEMWGCALALAAFDALTAYILEPRRSTLIATSVFAGMAILSRASVGFGAVLAIVVLGAATFTARTRRLVGLPSAWDERRRAWLPIGVAAGTPIVAYMYVNYAKFQSLFVFPSTKQLFSQIGVYRKAMLAQNHNSLFGFKFFPTALLQYIRPDALQFRSLVPFVEFPRTAHVIGGVLFDTIEPTSSVPSSMPIFAVLATIGFVAIVRGLFHRRRPADTATTATTAGAPNGTSEGTSDTAPGLGVLRIAIIGALASGFTVVPYSYIGQRYMSDFVPFLVIAGLGGLHLVLRWAIAKPRRVPVFVTVMSVATAFSMWVNAGLAYSYHHETDLVPEGSSGAFVAQQYSWHTAFPGGTAPYVRQGPTLPKPMARGTTFVVGDCQGVYWSQGNTWPPSERWYAIARTKATGQFDLQVRFNHVADAKVEPIVVRHGEHTQMVAALVTAGNLVSFGFYTDGHREFRSSRADGFEFGPFLKFIPGHPYYLTVTLDPNNGQISVIFTGFVAYAFQDFRLTTPQLSSYVFPADKVEIGKNTVDSRTTTAVDGQLLDRHLKRPAICGDLSLPRSSTGSSATK